MEKMYKVTEADLVGDIEGFPLEIVQMMVERQVEQGNEASVRIFQFDRMNGSLGFVWARTEEGQEFWNEVIGERIFDTFFARYPSGAPICRKMTKPIKNKHIGWTRQQKWVLERIPHDDTKSFLKRLDSMGAIYYGGEHIRSGFEMPVLASEIDATMKMFGQFEDSDCDMRGKIQSIAYAVNKEVNNISRIYRAYFLDCALGSIEMYTDIDSVERLRDYIKNWLKKNPWVGERMNSCIRFYGTAFSLTVESPRRMAIIPSSYTKDDRGFYHDVSRVLIGDISYLIH